MEADGKRIGREKGKGRKETEGKRGREKVHMKRGKGLGKSDTLEGGREKEKKRREKEKEGRQMGKDGGEKGKEGR